MSAASRPAHRIAALNRSDLLLLFSTTTLCSGLAFAALSLLVPRLLQGTIAEAMAADLARQAGVVRAMRPADFEHIDPGNTPLRFWPGPMPPFASHGEGGPEQRLLSAELARRGISGPLRCHHLPPFDLYCAYWLLVPRHSQPSIWMYSAPGRAITWLWPLIRTLSLSIGATAGLSLLLHRRVQRPIANLLNALPTIPTQQLELVPEAGIAALRELSVRINRCISSLNQTNESQRRFLEGLAHDLGSPLSRLSMRIELLESAGDPSGQLLQTLPQLRSDLDRLISVAHQLQQSTGAGETPFQPQATAIDELCERVAGSYPQGSLHLRTPRLIASVDARLIERALTNLIDNALRHGAPPVRLSATLQQHRLRLRVEDSGTGLVPSQLRMPRISPANDRQQSRGLGLGLSIVERCCQLHGGQLHLDRSSLGGLLAELELPQHT